MFTQNQYVINGIMPFQNQFFLNLSYNTKVQAVEFQWNYINTAYYPSVKYVFGTTTNETIPGNIIIPISPLVATPFFIINTQGAANLFNVPLNTRFPALSSSVLATGQVTIPPSTSTNFAYSGGAPLLAPPYVALNYKPNNAQYAQQGAVTASARLLRLKYNTITTNAGQFNTALGPNVGNAMAYGTSNQVYTIKDKTGFKPLCIPKIDLNTGKLKRCTNFIYRY